MLELPHEYFVTPDVELSSRADDRLFEFSPGDGAAVRTSCLVGVMPESASGWTGRFAGDYDEPPAISAVVSSPHPRKVFVVCSGRGYLVDADRPKRFGLVACFPICSIRTMGRIGQVVFGNFTDIVAYGRNGVLWQTTGLVSDDLNIVAVNDEMLTVDGLDAATGQRMRLSVDVRTGRQAV